MNFERLINTTGLFIGGAYCILEGIKLGMEHVDHESPITLLTTGALLFPLSILIKVATEKIFDDLGWEPSKAREITIYTFTFVSSVALASAAAVGFGLTTSLRTGWTVSFLALFMLTGISLVQKGVENISLGANHRVPLIIFK